MIPTGVEELYEKFLACGQKICLDTRKIEKNSIFFALKGPSFDANDFAHKALEQGCTFAVVDNRNLAGLPGMLPVEDVLKALQSLANHHRRKLGTTLLAITGSNGKTTCKELIDAVLKKKYNTLSTFGNLNNHIGVPLTLLKLKAEHEIGVIEMGANHQGEIASLCEIAEPDYGMITNIGKAHLEGFGGIEGVKKGKSELYRYLSKWKRKVFVNADDPVLLDLAVENDQITFGCKKLYDVIGKDCGSQQSVTLKYATRYSVGDIDKQSTIRTHMIGQHNLYNCLAAACVGNHFKVEYAEVKDALENYLPQMNRAQVMVTAKNRLILDAYNANPDSMQAAIDNFALKESAHKLLLLGDMFELGVYSDDEHLKIVDQLKRAGFSKVMLVGDAFYKTSNHPYLKFKTLEDCAAYLKKNEQTGMDILIKGSRGMKMEQLTELL